MWIGLESVDSTSDVIQRSHHGHQVLIKILQNPDWCREIQDIIQTDRRHLLNNRKSEDIDVEMTPVEGLKLLKNNVLMPLNAKIGLR